MMTTKAVALRRLTGVATTSLLAGGWLGLAACHVTTHRDDGAHVAADEGAARANAYVTQIPQILSAEKLAQYRRAAPKVEFGKLSEILADPDTFWYDHDSMPSSYQDSVAPDVTVGCRRNSAGPSLITPIPGGRQIFSPDGTTFNFPFGHTAGTDASTNTYIVDFMWLPKVGDRRLPVVYNIKTGRRGGFDLRQWRWMFPKGTVFGEMIFIKDAGDAGGELYPVELRTRERFLNGWATNAFRPYPTAGALAAAIKSKRPNWESSESLRRFVAHLGDNGTLTAKSVDSPVFRGTFSRSGALDNLPDLGDRQLTRELLTDKTFVSAYGATWKTNGTLKSFAASTSAAFSVVPNNYEAGLIEVRDESCHSCHKDAQRAINDFNSQAVLYGDIWGSDQIFSFHVFDPALCRGANEDNRALRPIFRTSGLVQTYDASSHSADFYKELP